MVKRGLGGRGRRAMKRRRPTVGRYIPMSTNRNKMGLVMNELVTTRHIRYGVSFTALSFAGSSEFRLSFLPNHTEFVTLFDCFKIWKVEVTFVPKYNSAEFGALTSIPSIYIASDRTDAGVPLTINEMCEYATCITRRFDRPVTYTVWPSIGEDGNVVVIDENQKNKWVNCTYPATQHYGIKYALDMPVGLASVPVDIVHKYFLKFKDVK